MNAERLLEVYEQISDAPDAIARLRRFVLDLAVRGKLVIQDAGDEPAHLLLRKIEAEKDCLVRAGEIRKRDAKPVSMLSPPFEIPASWCWTAVGTSFAYDAGVKTDPKKLDANRWLLELEDVEKETGRLLQRLKVCDREAKSTKSEFRSGDVLYGKLRPYLSKVVVADQAGYSTTEIVVIRPYFPLCSEYVALAFRRPDFVDYVERKGQGTKMPRLRTEDAVVAPFPLPPLAEQHRIVAKVDELMALCDRLEEAHKTREETRDKLTAASLARLTAPNTTPEDFSAHAAFALEALPALTTRPDQIKTLRQTILNLAVRGKLVEQSDEEGSGQELLDEVLSLPWKRKRKEADLTPDPDALAGAHALPKNWCWSTVQSLTRQNETVTYGILKPERVDDGVPTVRVTEMKTGAIDVESSPKCSVERAVKFAKTELAAGDLLISKDGTIGRTAFVPPELAGGNITQHMLRFPIAPQVDRRFVRLAIDSPFCQSWMDGETKGVALQGVNVGDFRRMPIPLPPLAEQHRIVAKVDALMALCDRLEAALTTADTTRTRLLEALLHEALEPEAEVLEAAE